MKREMLLLPVALLIGFGFTSCAEEPGKKPAGPVSENSQQSWTGQATNPLQGQFGMMPQNQHRR